MKKIIDLVAGLAVVAAAARSVAAKSESRVEVVNARPLSGDAQRTLPRAGRNADSPAQIPARGWKAIGRRVLAETKEDNLTTIAAAMTYYGLLALFPALIAIVTLYGIVADPADVQRQVSDIAAFLPEGGAEIVTTQLDQLASGSGPGLGFGFAISLGATLWTVSSGVSALIKAINLAYDETESRPFVKLRLLALVFTLGIILFVVAAIFTITALPAVLESAGVAGSTVALLTWLRWPALGLALVAGLAMFYRWAPNRKPVGWRWVTPGALFAAVVWIVASLALSFYVSNFGSYNETYGALGGVIVLLLWMFVSALVVLLGAELDAEIENQAQPNGGDRNAGLDEPVSKNIPEREVQESRRREPAGV